MQMGETLVWMSGKRNTFDIVLRFGVPERSWLARDVAIRTTLRAVGRGCGHRSRPDSHIP